MISVNQSIEILKSKRLTQQTEILPLKNCLNRFAAENLTAPIDVPIFDNSAMDGYGISFEDYKNNTPIKVQTTIYAGIENIPQINSGKAVRIFTGAPIPLGIDTIIPQEICTITNDILTFTEPIKKGTHIRKQGTQTLKGSDILKKGTHLTAQYLSFLATFGIQEILVYSPPKIGIIVTGDELTAAGNQLKEGQIYESNGITLDLALQQLGIQPYFILHVKDDPNQIYDITIKKINEVDVLIFTGGISVGDYDLVKPTLEKIGVKEQFYKIKQKPGKPFYFGTFKSKSIFALPGNPASVLTCFHVYIKPYLGTAMGNEPFDNRDYGILLNNFQKKSGITQFVKTYVHHQKVEILQGQMSYQMDAYQKANAYVILPENQEEFQIGEKVEIIYF